MVETEGANLLVVLAGSNLGDKLGNLIKAQTFIERDLGPIISRSSVLRTAPWGFESNEEFVNQVYVVSTGFTPSRCLESLLGIEKEIGRIRVDGAQGYTDRLIDLDILYFNEEVMITNRLIVPHPELQKRDFALKPLVEVLPDFVHPVLKKTNKELLEALTP